MRKILTYTSIVIVLAGSVIPIYAQTPLPSSRVPGANQLNTAPVVPCQTGYIRVEGSCVPDSSYILLAPLPCDNNMPGCVNGELKTFDPAVDKPLGSYLNIMIRIFIGICAVLAMAMIVVGGLEYMTSELVSSKESGRHKMTGALLGLVLALGSYALLNTINPDLLKSDVEIENQIIKIDLEADIPQTPDPVTRRYRNGALFGARWDDTVGAIATLPQYVTVANGECSTIGQTNCTSTRNLNTNIIQQIQWGCKCVLTITGGTESWLHGGKTGSTSHQLGGSTVDLRATPELTRYIAGDKPLVYFRRYANGDGNSYLYEGNHWHVGP